MKCSGAYDSHYLGEEFHLFRTCGHDEKRGFMKQRYFPAHRCIRSLLPCILLFGILRAEVTPQPHYGSRTAEPSSYDRTIEVSPGGMSLQAALDLADSDDYLAGGFSTEIVLTSGTHTPNATKTEWKEASISPVLCIQGQADGKTVLEPGDDAFYALKIDRKDNVIIRDITFTNAPYPSDISKPFRAYCFSTTKNPFSITPARRSNDWLIENCRFDGNGSQGAELHHVDYLTVRNCTFNGNGTGGDATGCFVCVRYSLFENVECRNNTRMGFEPFGIYYTKVVNLQCTGNDKNGFRMDHGCKELIVQGGEFSDNAGYGMMFETCIGPVDIKDAVISRNIDGIVMSTAHNMTIDGCTLEGNIRCAFQIYVRDRTDPDDCTAEKGWACTASDYDLDDQRWTNTIPIAWNDNTVVKNCAVSCYGSDAGIYWRNYGPNGQFERWLDEEFTGENNTYSNPDNDKVFDISPNIYGGASHTYVDLAGWQDRTGSDLTSEWKDTAVEVAYNIQPIEAARGRIFNLFTGKNGAVRIVTSEGAPYRFGLFAANGQCIARRYVRSRTYDFESAGLPAGIYSFGIESEGGMVHGSFLVK